MMINVSPVYNVFFISTGKNNKIEMSLLQFTWEWQTVLSSYFIHELWFDKPQFIF